MSTTTSNRFGSLIFCPRCGSLLDLPGDDDEIVCGGCGQVEDAALSENQIITTHSNPAAFPSSLRQKKTSLVQQRDVEKKKVYVSSALRIELFGGGRSSEAGRIAARLADERRVAADHMLFYRLMRNARSVEMTKWLSRQCNSGVLMKEVSLFPTREVASWIALYT